jgi:hypothetical protein
MKIILVSLFLISTISAFDITNNWYTRIGYGLEKTPAIDRIFIHEYFRLGKEINKDLSLFYSSSVNTDKVLPFNYSLKGAGVDYALNENMSISIVAGLTLMQDIVAVSYYGGIGASASFNYEAYNDIYVEFKVSKYIFDTLYMSNGDSRPLNQLSFNFLTYLVSVNYKLKFLK